MQKILFLDRDGTLLVEPPDEQIDSLDKFALVPGCLSSLRYIRQHSDYLLVLVSNQDGLGTAAFPMETFLPAHNLLLSVLASEGVTFDDILIDTSFPEDNAATRKPGTALVTKYLDATRYDLAGSYVIGDRESDRQFATNIGCHYLFPDWQQVVAVVTTTGQRTATKHRQTRETDVFVAVTLDGTGCSDIATGLPFFDHMLQQIAAHSGVDLTIRCAGDLAVDEHHTIEDVALTLGAALEEALLDKRGIARYGFVLPMDDCEAQVSLDCGGRPWLVWNVSFARDSVGGIATEMFFHFFKSLCDSAHCTLHIAATGDNTHHKIEAIFKAFARALRAAIRRDGTQMVLPTTKGTL